MSRQDKLLKTSAIAAVAVSAVFVVVMKDRILEQWYLHEFKSGDLIVKSNSAARLGDIGAEESLLALSVYEASTMPEVIFRHGMPGREGGAADPYLKIRPTTIEEARCISNCFGATQRIRDRIGLVRSRAACLRYMKRAGSDLRTRVWLSQLVILVVTPLERLPAMLTKPDALKRFEPGSQAYDQALGAKPSAISTCIEGLSSEDRYARGGAAFALSLCGAEARDAVPALERLVHDPDPFVGKAAVEALARIRDDQ
jgi:hypothetical protein